MSEYIEIAAHVERDVEGAALTVRREDGLFRHLEFHAPKTWTRITLVTWPYNLLVAGSHGSYHFERRGRDTEDVLDWLRGSRVDPERWASKLVNGRGSASEYDRALMVAMIRERVADAVENGWAPEGLEDAVRERVLDNPLLTLQDTAFQLVSEFQHGVTYRPECSCGLSGKEGSYGSAVLWETREHRADGKEHKVTVRRVGGFGFDDFTEWDVERPSYHFVYQCHAAAWAVGRYDAEREAEAVRS